MMEIRAEVIAIGDELTSGVRLDTNSQWISQQLGELGIHVAFHSTVGDNLADNVDVFRHAASRADVIIASGGLGPTADDLTRQAIANMANVDLVMEPSVLNHIKQMFIARGREMPSSNEVQAWFPRGCTIIDNPEGTAPGIDFAALSESGSRYRIFALPGVPVEMKQMWQATVRAELRTLVGDDFVIHHHTINCFGSGESHIETLLPGLVQRGRDPQVGITASAATISLRVSTRAPTKELCLEKMKPTIATIRECLGDLIYGENNAELHEVVVALLQERNQTIAILDAGLEGAVANLMAVNGNTAKVVVSSQIVREHIEDLANAAANIAKSTGTYFGLAIGPINRSLTLTKPGESFYDVVISDGLAFHRTSLRFSGHSGWRESRATKDVLNVLRLYLLKRA